MLKALAKQTLFSPKGAAFWGVLVAIALSLGWLLGSRYFGLEMVEKKALQVSHRQQKAQLTELTLELARVKSAAEIDQRSLQQVRKSMLSLQLALANSEEELWLYRHLLQGKAGSEGLLSSQVKLEPGALPGEIDYKLLIFRKKSKKNLEATVGYMLSIKGENGNKEMTFHVHAGGDEAGAQKATFKYFYVEEGSFQLPEGFNPQSVEVRIWKDKGMDTVITQVFPWQISRLTK